MDQQLKELEIKPNKLATQVALGFALYTLVLIFIFKLLGIDTQQENVGTSAKVISSILSYAPYVMAIMFVQNKHRTDLGGYISFGRAFSAGFRVSVYSGLFVALVMLLYYMVLDRSALDHLLEVAVDAAGDDENKVKGVMMMKPYMAYFIAFGAAITYTIFGLIVSLVGAFVFKKVNPFSVQP